MHDPAPLRRPLSSWSRRATRQGFLASIPGTAEALEIGPFCNPALTGPNVRYADIMDAEALRERATSRGRSPGRVPEIDHVLPNGDLSQIAARFDLVFSSHCVEHQPDLIHHLAQVAELLRPGGSYHLIIPDKRFCFDHFLPETLIGDVLQAHEDARRVHTLRSIVEHRGFTTHNRSLRHWLGMHGSIHGPRRMARIAHAIRQRAKACEDYVDVHAWQFTPGSFLNLISELSELKLSPLRPERVWHTPFPRMEFMAVLRKS